MASNFQQDVLNAVLDFLGPIEEAASDPDALASLFLDLGWETDASAEFPAQALLAAVAQAGAAITALRTALATEPRTFQELAAAFSAVSSAITAVQQLASVVQQGAPADFGDAPRQLLNSLLVNILLQRRPVLHQVLRLLAVVRDKQTTRLVTPTSGAVQRRQVTVEELDFGQVINLVQAPLATLKHEYLLDNGLTDPNATADLLFPRIVAVLNLLKVDAVYGVDPLRTVDFGTIGNVLLAHALTLSKTFSTIVSSTDAGFGLALLLDQDVGVVMVPFGVLTLDETIGAWRVQGTFSGGAAGFAVSKTDVVLTGSDTTVSLDLKLTRIAFGDELDTPDGALFVIGNVDGTHLQMGEFTVDLNANFGAGAPRDFGFSIDTGRSALMISGGDGDGFLGAVLPNDLSVDFQLAVGWSERRGLHFNGSAALEVVLPVTLSIAGVVTVESIAVTLAAINGALQAAVSADVTASLGPFNATVQGVGAQATLAFPTGGGSLGPADATTTFKIPDGVGISVDAGSVHGGGFLSFEPDAGRYSGAVQLSVYDIAVSAFGLIETNVPGGGFSFVIVISAEFTPIQLGFGFTLNGVGGLIGINRSVDGNALANLVRAGQSEELLFPRNVIGNAPAIIRDLGAVFPARQGHYVFGPLAKLGWGTPTLITGEIGVILELPGPVLAIVGEVKCALPKPDAPLLKLNLSVGGELDFPKKSFALDAALHDSVVNGFPISGQMAMRLRWGEDPNFALAVGGFHPAYQPPPDFPKLQPLAVDFGQQGAAAITVSGFFAITPNTLQIGGDARLHAGGSGISLDATVGVKALFVFTPFSFDARIDASVKISFHGHGPCVHLSGELSGPSPWHVRGEVCVSILFWDACLGFDTTFGGDQQVTQPELDPWVGDPANGIAGLGDALADAGHWAAVAPAGSAAVVTLAAGDQTLVDPLGGLTVKQKVAPVETTQPLTRFGVAKVTAPAAFTLQAASLVDDQGNALTALSTLSPVNDFFAPAQYFEMDDAKKLSSSGFEQRQAGYVFGENPNNLRPGSRGSRTMKYTTLVLGSDGSFAPAADYTASSDQVSSQARKSAAGLSGAGQAGTRKFTARLFVQPVDILQPVHVLASMTALTAVAGAPAAAPRSAALIALDAFRAQSPAQRLEVQVAATHELA